MSERPQFIQKKDPWIILCLLIISIFVWTLLGVYSKKKNSCYAEIHYNGSLVKTVYTDKPLIFSIDGLNNVVFEVRDGAVAFIRSDCPDQICVRAGWMNRPGQFAACLPNKVTLFVKGAEDDNDIDIIAR